MLLFGVILSSYHPYILEDGSCLYRCLSTSTVVDSYQPYHRGTIQAAAADMIDSNIISLIDIDS